MRFERLTFLVTSSFSYGAALFGVGPNASLWLDDCALMCAHDKALDPKFEPCSDPAGTPFQLQVSYGVHVYDSGRAVLSGCLIRDADGAGVFVDPMAARVAVERSVLTGCGRGEPGRHPHSTLGYTASGEHGAIEIQDGVQGDDLDDSYGPSEYTPLRVQIIVRDSQIEGNFGPALSFRPSGDCIRRQVPGGAVYARAQKLASAFTVENCQLRGNQIDPWVTVELMEGSDAVWNRTRRGQCFEDYGDNPDNDSVHSEEDEDEEDESGEEGEEDEEEEEEDDDEDDDEEEDEEEDEEQDED